MWPSSSACSLRDEAQRPRAPQRVDLVVAGGEEHRHGVGAGLDAVQQRARIGAVHTELADEQSRKALERRGDRRAPVDRHENGKPEAVPAGRREVADTDEQPCVLREHELGDVGVARLRRLGQLGGRPHDPRAALAHRAVQQRLAGHPHGSLSRA